MTNMTHISGVYLTSLWIAFYSGFVPVTSLKLRSYPDVAIKGELFTLTCFQQSGLLEVQWFINADLIFVSKIAVENQFQLPDGISDSVKNKFEEISGRINVSIYVNTHNVTLRIKSELDDGSNWRCHVGGVASNMITIIVVEHTTVYSSSTTTTQSTSLQMSSSHFSDSITVDSTNRTTEKSTGPQNQLTNSNTDSIIIPLVSGFVAGIVVLTSAFVVTIICILKRRKNKRTGATQSLDPVTSEQHVYSTMSHDPEEGNHYTGLEPGTQTTSLSPRPQVVKEDTDTYYNAVLSERSSYENPPLHRSAENTNM